MVDIVSLDLLEDELNAVTQAGNYGSRTETIGHALEILLVNRTYFETRSFSSSGSRWVLTQSRSATA